MTAQRTDTIIINGNRTSLYSLPLDQYWEKNVRVLSLLGGNTGLWRGYHATWQIENEKLWLVEFYGENFLLRKEYDLGDLFPEQKRVFAEWYTGSLNVPAGKQTGYFHCGLGGGQYEYLGIIKVEAGVVKETEFENWNDN